MSKDESFGFRDNVVPYVHKLLESHRYSPNVCHQLMNPLSEKLNLDLVLSLIKHICSQQVKFINILLFKLVNLNICKMLSLKNIIIFVLAYKNSSNNSAF